MAGKRDKKAGGTIIIKREEIVEGGHHGGAWKVAYADFVTAMMAFFLLMWLLNATTEDQRRGLADYFSPNNVLSHTSSGTGEPFGGHYRPRLGRHGVGSRRRAGHRRRAAAGREDRGRQRDGHHRLPSRQVRRRRGRWPVGRRSGRRR